MKIGRPTLNAARAVVVDSLGTVSPEVLMQDSCLRAWLRLGSVRAVADALGISVGLAHRHIKDGSEYLREAGSPEHRAAVLGLLVSRTNRLWHTIDSVLKTCVDSDQLEKVASLSAVGAKLCDMLGKFHGIGADVVTESNANQASRLEETARRLALIGPNSRAAEMSPVLRASLSLSGAKPADAVEIIQEPPPEA